MDSFLLVTIFVIVHSTLALSLPADLLYGRADLVHIHHAHSDTRHAHSNTKLDHHGKMDAYHHAHAHAHAKRDASLPLAQSPAHQHVNSQPIVNERRGSVATFDFGRGLMMKFATESSNLDNIIAILTLQHDDILADRDAMSKYGSDSMIHVHFVTYAQQSRSTRFSLTKAFQTGCTRRLGDLKASLDLFSATLKPLGAEKRLANYDRSDEVETLLKDVVNALKDTLEAIDCLVSEVPVLGDTVSPVVYELKSLIDDILSVTKNLLHNIINAAGLSVLSNLLHPLVAGYKSRYCSLLALDGICLL